MNTYIIVDFRSLSGLESNFELDASISTHQHHLTHEMLRFAVTSMSLAWMSKPVILSPDQAGDVRVLSSREYQSNFSLLQNLSIPGAFSQHGIIEWDKFFSSSLRQILSNIDTRRRSGNEYDMKCTNNTLVVIHLTDMALSNISDDQDWHELLSVPYLQQLKQTCPHLEIRIVCTVVSQLPGTYNISVFDKKLYRLVDYLRNDNDHDVSYNILHNSMLHLSEEFRILLSKHLIPITSKLLLPTSRDNEQISIMVELVPPHLISTSILHPGLMEMSVVSAVQNLNVNICDIEGFPLTIKAAGINSDYYHGDQARYENNAAMFLNINKLMLEKHVIFILRCRRILDNSFEHWALISSQESPSESIISSGSLTSFQMVIMKLTDKDSLLHCQSSDEDRASKRTIPPFMLDNFASKVTDTEASVKSSLLPLASDPLPLFPRGLISGRFESQVQMVLSSQQNMRRANTGQVNPALAQQQAVTEVRGKRPQPPVDMSNASNQTRYPKQRRIETISKSTKATPSKETPVPVVVVPVVTKPKILDTRNDRGKTVHSKGPAPVFQSAKTLARNATTNDSIEDDWLMD